ncbi:PA14 domain-containing protein [Candidatus Amarolinea aalborgensis]|uniref:PA14 domain-containing protein n=1 Tax=Candidatus Amarolinea aalborgensis TaxID=2249329 RepID=UPI003BFA1204
MSQLLALLAAAVLAWQGLRSFATPPYTADGWLWMAGAAVLAAFAYSRTAGLSLKIARGLFSEPAPRHTWGWAGRWPLLIGLAFLLVGIGANVWANLTLYEKVYDIPATVAWTASLLLALLGIGLMQRRQPDALTHGPGGSVSPDALTDETGVQRSAFSIQHSAWYRRLPYLELALVALLALVAIFFRVYRLTTMPPGIFIDQTNGALDALAVLEGRQASPFGTSWYEIPTMYVYFMLGMFKLLGTTWLALVLASIVPAVLTVLAVYPLARTLFGVPSALAAMAFMAFNRWHINMSRWGWIEVSTPLFQVLCVLFLVRAAKNRRLLDFALAGLFLGLGMYSYLAIRMAVVAVALYVLYRLLVQRGFWRMGVGLALMALLYLMTFSPLAVHYSRNPFTFLNRSQQVSIFNDVKQAGSYQPLWENLRRHAEMFTVRGDTNPRHNLPGAPMVDPVTGALLLIGFGYGLWRVFDHRYGLLLIWIPVTLAGGVLSSLIEGPQAFRTIGVVPAVAILAGDMLARGWVVLRSALDRGWARSSDHAPGASPLTPWSRWAWLTLLAPAALLAFAAYANYTVFFDRQAHDDTVWQAFSPVETAVAREVQSKLSTHTLYLAPRLFYFSPLIFLTYRAPSEGGGGLSQKPYLMAQPVDDLPLPSLSGQDALFLLDTHYQDLMELFTVYYPGTTSHMVTGPRGQPLYLSVNVPGGEIAALHGLNGDYGGVARRDSQINFTWPQDWPAGAPVAPVTWTGSLRMPHTDQVDFRSDGNLQIDVDGQTWTGARLLGKGLHALRITQADPASAGRAALYWTQAGQGEQLVPAEVLFGIGLPQHGLVGTYYSTENWTGPPAFTVISPLVLFAWAENEPWAGPFSDSFSGELEAPVDGSYFFSVNGDDGVRLWLDGKVVGEALQPDTANEFNATVSLTAGRHAIRVDHFQRGGGKALELWWQPPNGPRQVVPPSVLWP